MLWLLELLQTLLFLIKNTSIFDKIILQTIQEGGLYPEIKEKWQSTSSSKSSILLE